MLRPLQRTFDRLTQQKNVWLAQYHSMEPQCLEHRPAGGGWNALEILDHLIVTEAEIVGNAILSLPAGHPVSLRDRVQGLLMEGLFRSPAKVKVPPEAARVLPQTQFDLQHGEARWAEVRSQAEAWLHRVSSQQIRLGCFRHPVSGWMDLPQTLRFLSAHLVHHRYQFQRQQSAYRAAQR